MGRLVLDPKAPDIDKSIFHLNADWKEFYGDVTKELPPNMPKPQGHPVSISAFVDANHAGNFVTQRSHSLRWPRNTMQSIIMPCVRQLQLEFYMLGKKTDKPILLIC
jgi:hypothetical protein